jgi:hypothetical protein
MPNKKAPTWIDNYQTLITDTQKWISMALTRQKAEDELIISDLDAARKKATELLDAILDRQ